MVQEKAHSGDKDKAKVFSLLRHAFGITKEALVEGNTASQNQPKSEDKKEEEAPKVDA